MTFFNLTTTDLLGKVIIIQGPGQSGKTQLCKYLLRLIQENTEDPIFEIISGTTRCQGYMHQYRDILDIPKVNQKYDRQIILDHINWNMPFIDQAKVLLLEDCLSNDNVSKDWTKDTSIRYLFTRGKSAGFSTIICTRHLLRLPQILLKGVDLWFISENNYRDTLRTMSTMYGGINYTMPIKDRLHKFDFVIPGKGYFHVPLGINAEVIEIQKAYRHYLTRKQAIPQFDMKALNESYKLIIIHGTRTTGKTVVVKKLLSEFKKNGAYINVCAINPDEYSSLEPDEIHRQLKSVHLKKDMHNVIVFDDISTWSNASEPWSTIKSLVNSPCSVTFVIVSQCIHDIPKSLLKDTSQALIFIPSRIDVKCGRYFVQYGIPTESAVSLKKKFRLATKEPYSFFVIDTLKSSVYAFNHAPCGL